MAILLELIYGKRVGLPQYSSHHFNVSLKSEVAAPEDIQQEVERVYHILQSSVDQQIVNPGFVPGGKGSNGTQDTNGSGWRCSEKQKALIEKLVSENKLDRNEVEQLAIDRFGHGVKLLNKLEASGLIEELIQQTGGRNGRSGKRGRSYAGRKAA